MRTYDLMNRVLPEQKNARQIIMLVADVLVAMLAGVMALWIRLDFGAGVLFDRYIAELRNIMYVPALLTVFIFFIFSIYKIMWAHASIREAVRLFEACLLIMLFQLFICVFMGVSLPRSFFLISFMLQFAMEFVIRFSYRMAKSIQSVTTVGNGSGPRTIIIGAGEAGHLLGNEMRNSGNVKGEIVGFVDDNPGYKGKIMNGIPVMGNRHDIPEIVKLEDINQIFIAIPSAERKDVSEIIDICKNTGCDVKILPGIYQMTNGDVSISKLRPVQIEDLLGREQIKVNMSEIASYVRDKTVLITGGGGSIGSELCRQVAVYNPKLLIIFDIYENNAYAIEQELKKIHPETPVLALIGSVRNTERITQVIRDYRPDIIYHAAAHKHVPLMENSPKEAIKNNVFGTVKTAQAAGQYGVKRFVLISTDKAVNPTNIMGASKRMCEMVIQMMNTKYQDTDYVAVRFGNVLGSNGSVIPLFKRQIEFGGPVTVTHPDIIRYFMTIPEAVSLVMQAGAYAKGGEIFILDMGEPVKIKDLAENMIRLSGYKPYEEIDIKYTGLRPGEKLYEEMLMSEEGMHDTPNHMIHIGKPIDMDYDKFIDQLRGLYPVANSDECDDDMKKIISEIVTTYHPQYQKDMYIDERDNLPDNGIAVNITK